MFSRRLELFLEFLLFGVAIGIVEDILAIKFATGHAITWEVIGIAFLVAVPFAALGELIVDKQHLIPVRGNHQNPRKKK